MKDEFLGQKKNRWSFVPSVLKNQKGQFAIEAVLLTTILVGGFLVLTKEAKNRNIVGNLVSKPMKRLGNMAGYGTWKDQCRAQGGKSSMTLGKCHPNSIHRSLSSKPE